MSTIKVKGNCLVTRWTKCVLQST